MHAVINGVKHFRRVLRATQFSAKKSCLGKLSFVDDICLLGGKMGQSGLAGPCAETVPAGLAMTSAFLQCAIKTRAPGRANSRAE